MDKSLTIALAQLAGSNRVADNLVSLKMTVEAAACSSPRPDLLVFPEGFLTGYYVDNVEQVALTRQTVSAMLGPVARANKIALVSGYIERESAVLYNAAIVVDEQGDELATYRKRCLYGDWERQVFTPGKVPCVFNWCGWCLGLIVCYDVEFPEVPRELAMAGAEVVITATALMQPDEALIFALLPARAIENDVFIVYANRVGDEQELNYVGCSCVVNPRGEILAQADSKAESVLQTTLIKPVNTPPSQYLTDILRFNDQS